MSFLLTDNLQLKKINFTDTVLDQAGDEGGFDTDVAIATGELAKLIPDLIEALDGEGRTEIGLPTTGATTLAVRVSRAGAMTGPASAPDNTATQDAPF